MTVSVFVNAKLAWLTSGCRNNFRSKCNSEVFIRRGVNDPPFCFTSKVLTCVQFCFSDVAAVNTMRRRFGRVW